MFKTRLLLLSFTRLRINNSKPISSITSLNLNQRVNLSENFPVLGHFGLNTDNYDKPQVIINELYRTSKDPVLVYEFFKWYVRSNELFEKEACERRLVFMFTMVHILVSNNMNFDAVEVIQNIIPSVNGRNYGKNERKKAENRVDVCKWSAEGLFEVLGGTNRSKTGMGVSTSDNNIKMKTLRNENERKWIKRGEDTGKWFGEGLFEVLRDTHRSRKGLEVVFNMVVMSLVKEDCVCVRLLEWMKREDMFPTARVGFLVLKGLLEKDDMELAWDFLEEFENRGMGNVRMMSMFIDKYFRDGKLEEACRILVDVKERGLKEQRFKVDVVLYTIVINTFCKRGFVKLGAMVLFKMVYWGVRPDPVSVAAVVDGYCRSGKLKEGMHVMSFYNYPGNVYVYNSVICSLCREGNMEEACKYFRKIYELGVNPDLFNYTAIIGGYCRHGNIGEALKYLDEMLKRGFKLSIVTYTELINGFCMVGNFSVAENLFNMVKVQGLNPDVYMYNTLIDGYCRKGLVHKAYQVLDSMKASGVPPDVTSYNFIVSGLAQRGFIKESRYFVDELIRRGFKVTPDLFTYTSVIHGFSKGGNLEEVLLVWSLMSEQGLKPDVITCSALINGYCKAYEIEKAFSLFQKMLEYGLVPDIILYNTLINGFCIVGKMRDVWHLVSMMVEQGIIPNDITYRTLVYGCQKIGVEDSRKNVFRKLQSVCRISVEDLCLHLKLNFFHEVRD